jgi:hypothetical protein
MGPTSGRGEERPAGPYRGQKPGRGAAQRWSDGASVVASPHLPPRHRPRPSHGRRRSGSSSWHRRAKNLITTSTSPRRLPLPRLSTQCPPTLDGHNTRKRRGRPGRRCSIDLIRFVQWPDHQGFFVPWPWPSGYLTRHDVSAACHRLARNGALLLPEDPEPTRRREALISPDPMPACADGTRERRRGVPERGQGRGGSTPLGRICDGHCIGKVTKCLLRAGS